MDIMSSYKTTYFIYLAVFLAEFSFFFSLPLLGMSPDISAASVGTCLAGAIILESLLMFTTTGYLEYFSRRKLIFVSFLLRSLAFLSIYMSLSLLSWLMFFLLISVSKSISKPFLREILAESLSGTHLKKAMNTFSLSQNIAVFIAPSLAALALKYNFMNEVILLVILSSSAMAIAALTINHTLSRNKSNPTFASPLVGLLYAFRGNMAKEVQSILLASFFCFLIMGIFITSTTLLGKISPELEGYSGFFFSIVGVTICLWQGVVAKLKTFNERWISRFIVICGAFSSIYLLGSVYIAVIALVAYSIYESVIIPEIYVKASGINSEIPSGVLFSYIVILSNAGSAFGSWITGVAIENIPEHVPSFIFIAVFSAAIASFIFLKRVITKEV
ncbi:MFS transporter [Mechercharimyces sp. CAU 1602]|uniref:MFS transporter n=1 Tax=Mechercharimyces sp. CAU 1602 TaxID=2973933 RepID=UPI002162810C|nr:MFS transporter [Mechercharimyces sp. CAU 1602]MCS1352611.1 hypothetical protein [Mechercharimyces sp. CAU 1602]